MIRITYEYDYNWKKTKNPSLDGGYAIPTDWDTPGIERGLKWGFFWTCYAIYLPLPPCAEPRGTKTRTGLARTATSNESSPPSLHHWRGCFIFHRKISANTTQNHLVFYEYEIRHLRSATMNLHSGFAKLLLLVRFDFLESKIRLQRFRHFHSPVFGLIIFQNHDNRPLGNRGRIQHVNELSFLLFVASCRFVFNV